MKVVNAAEVAVVATVAEVAMVAKGVSRAAAP